MKLFCVSHLCRSCVAHVSLVLHLCCSFVARLALLLHLCCSSCTRLELVLLMLHICCTCVALVLNSCCLCCTRLALMLYNSLDPNFLSVLRLLKTSLKYILGAQEYTQKRVISNVLTLT